MKRLKEQMNYILYIICKAIIKHFEVTTLLNTFIISCVFYDFKVGIQSVILGIFLIPLGWKIFDWPELRKKELKKIDEIYKETLESEGQSNCSD